MELIFAAAGLASLAAIGVAGRFAWSLRSFFSSWGADPLAADAEHWRQVDGVQLELDVARDLGFDGVEVESVVERLAVATEHAKAVDAEAAKAATPAPQPCDPIPLQEPFVPMFGQGTAVPVLGLMRKGK